MERRIMRCKLGLVSSWSTTYNADSVEWCPHKGYDDLFVCGTYKLIECDNNAGGQSPKSSAVKSQQRIGSLCLFEFNKMEPYLTQLQSIDTPAILDCKWCPLRLGGRVLLAVANAQDSVCVYQLLDKSDTLDYTDQDCENAFVRTRHISLLSKNRASFSTDDISQLTLSVDWSVGLNCDRSDRNHVSLALSDSSGRITIFNLFLNNGDVSVEKLGVYNCHDGIAWTVAFDHWSNGNTLYSGGDDCKLCILDQRSKAIVSVKKNLHLYGITVIGCSPFDENKLVSGSYDEMVYIWDKRKIRHPVGSLSVGGGIWRLKWEPEKGNSILCATMHDGFKILDCSVDSMLSINASYDAEGQHKSLAYGADWNHSMENMLSAQFLDSIIETNNLEDKLENVDRVKLISTCSFYDNKLCVSYIIT